MPSFLIYTLGCKLNQLESEAVADAFNQAGFIDEEIGVERQNFANFPTVIVINTCTVTSKADQKARRVIRKALRDYPAACVVVTGCYAQLNKDDILRLETGDKKRLHVVNKESVLDFISTYNDPQPPTPSSQFQFNPRRFSSHTRSFLKIQDGCDRHCTYCKIRLVRGPSVSLEANEVLSRLRMLEQSHAEAVLAGVNISQYRDLNFFCREPHELIPSVCTRTEEEKVFDLSELLDYLLSGTEKIAVRLSSLAPESVDEKLVKVLSHPRIRPHFHLSIQSCSQKILERMGRSYNAEIVERSVSLLRSSKDDPFLACDIITGFPGETDAEFEETFSLCQKLDFAWIHVFPYSKRAGTPAFSFKDTVHESDVTKRVKLFTDLAKKGSSAYVKRWLGREVDVLIEKEKNFTANHADKHKQFFYNGVSENYLKVLVSGCEIEPPPGTVLKCKLEKVLNSDDFDVQGTEIKCQAGIAQNENP